MNLSDFDIDINRISKGKMELSYLLSDTFFSLKENSLYSSGKIDASIQCDKYESSINFHIALDGAININCERCLDEIQLPVKSKFLHVVKQTAEPELLDNESYISIDANKVNVYDTIYEHICLAMPLRKICSNSLMKKECKIEYLELPSTEKEENPIWNELKKLKQ